MNIDAYNLDSLRALVRKLEKENQNLKQKLNEANTPYNSENIFVESSEENAEYDLNQGGRIMERQIMPEAKEDKSGYLYEGWLCGGSKTL